MSLPEKKLKFYGKKTFYDGFIVNFNGKSDVKIRIGLWKSPLNTTHKGQNDSPKGTVILLPGATEFIEKYKEVIRELRERGFAVAIMDWRGQGLSGRLLRNRHKHHVDKFETYLSDLESFIEGIEREGLPKPFSLLAHSMGGHLALRYIHDNPTAIKRAVLSAPMCGIRYGFIPEILAKGLIARAIRKGRAEDYAPGQGNYGPRKRGKTAMRFLTHDPVRFMDQHNEIDKNPDLALGGQTFGWLDAANKSIKVLSAPGYPEAINTPTLIVQAGQDLLVKNKASARIAARIPNAKLERIPKASHEILKEVDAVRDQFWTYFDEFMTS